MPLSTKGLEHGMETIPHNFHNQIWLTRAKYWRHPLLSKPIQHYIKLISQKGRVRIKIFLSLIYYPGEYDEQKRFNEEMSSLYNEIPRNTRLLAGQCITANVGVQSKMFSDVLGQQGLDNINAKR